MDVRRVDANLLVPLEAILVECNLTRAGLRLGMTQATMSGALARLRAQLSDPLLVRVGRRYELTDRAVELLPVVRDAVAAASRTLQVHPGFQPLTSERSFTIAASDFAMSVLAAPLLALFRDQAPNVTLEFVPLPQLGDPGDLLRRDLVIASSGRGLPGRRQRVFSDRFVVLVDAANPALRDGRLTLADLQSLPYVAGVFDEAFSTAADDMLAASGVEPRRAITCRGFMSLPFFIPGTNMVGIVPATVARQTAAALGLVIAETPLAATEVVEIAHWHPSSSADPGLRWLLACLRDSRIADVDTSIPLQFPMTTIESLDPVPLLSSIR
jgi:DNA-binding transcriptional LysR family regulator